MRRAHGDGGQPTDASPRFRIGPLDSAVRVRSAFAFARSSTSTASVAAAARPAPARALRQRPVRRIPIVQCGTAAGTALTATTRHVSDRGAWHRQATHPPSPIGRARDRVPAGHLAGRSPSTVRSRSATSTAPPLRHVPERRGDEREGAAPDHRLGREAMNEHDPGDERRGATDSEHQRSGEPV